MLSLTDSLPLHPLATLRLSAASALVCRGEQFWVLADDALTLQRYDLAGAWQAELQLLPGELPTDSQQRKAQKPDFEALLHLPDGRLLALGSGSTAARCRACLVSGEQVQVINLQPLYQALLANDVPLRLPPETVEYRIGDSWIRVHQLMIQDPDGYLLRFSQVLDR